jgi:hypothetical protein
MMPNAKTEINLAFEAVSLNSYPSFVLEIPVLFIFNNTVDNKTDFLKFTSHVYVRFFVHTYIRCPRQSIEASPAHRPGQEIGHGSAHHSSIKDIKRRHSKSFLIL